VLAIVAAEAVDEGVSPVEGERTEEEPKCDAAVSGCCLERLADELEGDSADENSCAEGHDQAERASADRYG
jgi:hypothetical protein